MSVKLVLRELKEIGIDSPHARKEIVHAFSGGNGKQSDEVKEKNKRKVFNILMSKDSIIKDYLLENFGLSERNIIELESQLSQKEFFDVQTLFGVLRDFISNHYKTIDMVTYRYNALKNSLDIFSGKKSLAINLSLNNITSEDHYNEVLAYTSETEKFFHSSVGVDLFDGGIGSVKLVAGREIYVFSFYIKETLINGENEDITNDVLKIKKFFTRCGLHHRIYEIIKYIDAKYKDQLTGLFNKNYIDALPKYLKMSVLFIDLDRFKSINDTYGHQNGDIVLKEVAKVLTDSVKCGDRVGRVSGDEFLILVMTNNPSYLELLECRINIGLGNLDLHFINRTTNEFEKVSITASIGKGYHTHKKLLSQIIDEADGHMYKNKGSEGQMHRIFVEFMKLSHEEQKRVLEMGICDVRCGYPHSPH